MLNIQSLIALSSVSKELNMLCQDPYLWKYFLLRDFGSIFHNGEVFWKEVQIIDPLHLLLMGMCCFLALHTTVQGDEAEGEGEGNQCVPRGFSSGSPVAPQTTSAFRPPISWNNR